MVAWRALGAKALLDALGEQAVELLQLGLAGEELLVALHRSLIAPSGRPREGLAGGERVELHEELIQ